MNKTRIIKLILPFLIIVVGGLYAVLNNVNTAFAVGDLVINWGVPTGDPIFVVNNILPGDTEERTVDITNNATSTKTPAVRGIKTSVNPANFTDVLEITIKEGLTTLYGPVSLEQFFTDSVDPDGIPLTSINNGANKTYSFKVTFDPAAGNEFQNASVVFDIQIGVSSEIPADCQGIIFSNPPIFGTDGNDRIRGTLGNDLIFALEGNDRVMAFGGDDCIIGGPGNDELRGEVGNDLIFGNEGDDLVVGASGEDTLFGGDGNDNIRGENGEDYIEGGDGNDTITGGNSDDQIFGQAGNDNISSENGEDIVSGGEGNDSLDGGGGNDVITGDSGNDNINGKAGNDNLTGGTDTDVSNGLSGTDTCDAETELNCEL